jgi:outer membrane immunogenic protein
MENNGTNNMRKLLHTIAAVSALLTLSMAANAADIGVRPPAYVPPPFSWTGFYIGGNIGGAWYQSDVTDNFFGLVFHNPSNNGVFIGGGQVGFNYQFSNIVLGVESDFDWAGNNNNTGNGIVVPGINGIVQVTSSNRWVTTVAARFGVTGDYWLFYGKAGGGWVGTNDFTVTNVTSGASITAPSNNTNSGWLVGVGIEWAFAPNWSAKFEYDYLGLNNRTFTVPGGGFLAGDTFTINNPNVQTVKVGINYLFNYGVGRY